MSYSKMAVSIELEYIEHHAKHVEFAGLVVLCYRILLSYCIN